MNPSKTFTGVYPTFLLYGMLVALGLFALIFLGLSIIAPFFLILFLLVSSVFLIVFYVHRNQPSSIFFLKEHVAIICVFGKSEFVDYRHLENYFIKYEGFKNRTISTIQYRSKEGEIKSVDFKTYNLDHRQFKADLISLKKSQPST